MPQNPIRTVEALSLGLKPKPHTLETQFKGPSKFEVVERKCHASTNQSKKHAFFEANRRGRTESCRSTSMGKKAQQAVQAKHSFELDIEVGNAWGGE